MCRQLGFFPSSLSSPIHLHSFFDVMIVFFCNANWPFIDSISGPSSVYSSPPSEKQVLFCMVVFFYIVKCFSCFFPQNVFLLFIILEFCNFYYFAMCAYAHTPQYMQMNCKGNGVLQFLLFLDVRICTYAPSICRWIVKAMWPIFFKWHSF